MFRWTASRQKIFYSFLSNLYSVFTFVAIVVTIVVIYVLAKRLCNKAIDKWSKIFLLEVPKESDKNTQDWFYSERKFIVILMTFWSVLIVVDLILAASVLILFMLTVFVTLTFSVQLIHLRNPPPHTCTQQQTPDTNQNQCLLEGNSTTGTLHNRTVWLGSGPIVL